MDSELFRQSEVLFTRKYNNLLHLIYYPDQYNLLTVAAILRLLLLDGSPLLHVANRNYRIRFRFEICKQNLRTFSDGSRLVSHSTEIGDMRSIVSPGQVSLNLSNFLQSNWLEKGDIKFTAREIIKYLSNQKGGVHYEAADNPMLQIDEFALSVAVREIGKVVLIELEKLKLEIIKLPSSIPLFAHYNTGRRSYAHFFGIKQFMEYREINSSINDAFGIFLEINILKQPMDGTRVVYEIGGEGKCFGFRLQITNDGQLEAISKYNSKRVIKTAFPNYSTRASEQWMNIACLIKFSKGQVEMRLYLQGRVVSSASKKVKAYYTEVKEQTIGSNLKGKRNCAMKYRELIILNDVITSDEEKAIFRYFEGNWRGF